MARGQEFVGTTGNLGRKRAYAFSEKPIVAPGNDPLFAA